MAAKMPSFSNRSRFMATYSDAWAACSKMAGSGARPPMFARIGIAKEDHFAGHQALDLTANAVLVVVDHIAAVGRNYIALPCAMRLFRHPDTATGATARARRGQITDSLQSPWLIAVALKGTCHCSPIYSPCSCHCPICSPRGQAGIEEAAKEGAADRVAGEPFRMSINLVA
jgi:hypothetical protein